MALVVGASQPFFRHLEEVPPHMEIDHGIIQSHPQSECAERGCPGRIQ